MKTFIVFLLWLIVGTLIGGKLSYEYVTSKFTDNMDTIVGQIVDQSILSGAHTAAYELQNKWEAFIAEQKAKAKEALKAELTRSINEQIDAFLK